MKPFLASFTSPQRGILWNVFVLPGMRSEESDLDTLKKISSSLPGFGQVFPLSRISSFEHLAWAAYSTIAAGEGGFAHYAQPSLEFLCRVAGNSQWQMARNHIGLSSSDSEVVLVWISDDPSFTSMNFLSLSKKWGLVPKKMEWGKSIRLPLDWCYSISEWGMEQSALTDGR
ncbi:MAG: hypothetical protein V1776_02375 [Candidatus Diapherotrites archaeon]